MSPESPGRVFSVVYVRARSSVDRAFGCGPKGRRSDSCRAHKKTPRQGSFWCVRSKRMISLASGIGRRNGFPSQENREAVPNPSRATARREVKEIPAERTKKTPFRGFYRARSKRTISLASGIGHRSPVRYGAEHFPRPGKP